MGVFSPSMSVVWYRVIVVQKKGNKMNEFQKAIALADRYAKAGIQLTEAEKNLLRYLANKK